METATSSAITSAETDRRPANLPALSAGGAKILPIVPTDIDQVWRLAKAIALAGWAPKGYRTGEKKDGPFSEEMIAIGIMQGLEVGLSPIAALQSIAVINGMPSIWGDGALGLVLASGLVEDLKEIPVKDTTGKIVGFKFYAKRRGRPQPIEQQFLEADAKRAGLIGKAGPWTQYEGRMYQMRARAWGLRDGFADVLKGLHIAEEAIDITPISGPGFEVQLVGLDTGGSSETVAIAPWSDEKFVSALKNWSKLIYNGTKTHDEIIELAETKHPLTDGQKASIRTLKKKASEEGAAGPATEDQIRTIQEKSEKAAITNAEIFKKFGITTFEGLPAAQVQPILEFIANPMGG